MPEPAAVPVAVMVGTPAPYPEPMPVDPAADPAVEIDGVHRSFGAIRALDGMSLTVGRGEVVGLLGHNGAGKTTTVRLLLGILAPDRGAIRVLGRDPLHDGPDVRRSIGLVSATPGVDERLTARQNLAFAADVYGVDDRERAGALLEQFDLYSRADDRVAGFSTGMRQRLALARALLHDPPLLLLDEPTAALDPVVSREVRATVERLAGEGRSVVLCSHNLTEAQQLCDRVVVLQEGRVIAEGAPMALAASLGLTRLRLLVDAGDRAAAESAVVGLGGAVEGRNGQLAVTGLDASVVPGLVAALVDAGVRVHGVVPEDASLEDVYFALHDGGAR
jgi:ABC-2 type transport system ATP-binding protein